MNDQSIFCKQWKYVYICIWILLTLKNFYTFLLCTYLADVFIPSDLSYYRYYPLAQVHIGKTFKPIDQILHHHTTFKCNYE